MKRSVALVALALTAAASGYSQVSLSGFQTAFTTFAGDLAGSLALSSTIGSNWSDAYVGGFPHLGVGVTAGTAFVSADGATSLFDAISPGSLPSQLTSLGIPLPVAVGTFKIGIPFLPIDVGIKGGYIPPSVGASLLSSSGLSVNYENIGVQVRYALLKQNLILPNISIGAAYNYQKGTITKTLTGVPSQSFTVPSAVSGGPYTLNVASPNLDLNWSSNTFDFTAQVSKLLLFLVPYVGAGLTVGTSSVTGGLDANTTTNYPGGVTALAAALASAGVAVPSSMTDAGFAYTATANSPLFRVYGGVSFRIIVLDFDAQVMYVPVSKAFGASLTARVQF